MIRQTEFQSKATVTVQSDKKGRVVQSRILGTLSKDDDDGSESVGKKKNEFTFFQT